ncbi:hypothetical protein GCM10023166_06430 [Paeniglutamicibacter cryotolerans]
MLAVRFLHGPACRGPNRNNPASMCRTEGATQEQSGGFSGVRQRGKASVMHASGNLPLGSVAFAPAAAAAPPRALRVALRGSAAHPKVLAIIGQDGEMPEHRS